MATTRLTRTLGTPTNRKKLTASMWLKKSFNGTEKHFFGMGTSGGYLDFRFANTGELELYHYNSGYQFRLTTTRKFRDTNAWYHLVFTIDTTLGTADDRFKVYVNGVQETVFTNRTNPSQDYEIGANASGNTISVGNYGTNTNNSFDGIISHVHFSDGYAYDPTPFGETDSATGEWKIKTSVTGVTYGNNGFWWLKDTIATTDHSSNSNNFTVGGGTLTKTEDCPSNVFATWNKLDWGTTYFTLTNGSTTAQSNASVFTYGVSTLGVNSGKFYWEVEYDAKNGGNRFPQIGITSTQTTNTQYELGHYANDWCWYINNTTSTLRNNNSDTSWGNYYQEGDIIGVALDCTNNKLYFSKNGTWQESGDPSAGNNGISITAPSSTPLGFYFPAICYYDSTHRGTFKANFGNGYFGSTQISSAGTNASGNGIFEYDVPTGYTALSTKGLNL